MFEPLLFETQEPSPGWPGFPRSLQTQWKVKSKQAKSTQAKGKPEDFFSFSFFQSLKGLLSKVSISNKKNRQFQLLKTSREEQPLSLEREKTHHFQQHFCQQHLRWLLWVSQEEPSKGEKTWWYAWLLREVTGTRHCWALLKGSWLAWLPSSYALRQQLLVLTTPHLEARRERTSFLSPPLQRLPFSFSPAPRPPPPTPTSPKTAQRDACPWAKGIQSPRKGTLWALGALGGWRRLKRGVLYVVVVYSPAALWSSQFLTRGQVRLFLLVGSVFLSSPVVFGELEGGCSKTSFQLHHKTGRGWPMAASSR